MMAVDGPNDLVRPNSAPDPHEGTISDRPREMVLVLELTLVRLQDVRARIEAGEAGECDAPERDRLVEIRDALEAQVRALLAQLETLIPPEERA